MNERHKMLLKTVPFLAVGILIFILYLTWFVDIPKMINVIQRANMLVYSLAALTLILSTFLFALTWQYLLIPLSIRIPLKKTFAYVWIGVFADLLIPAEAVSGEIVKAYLISKEPNINPGKVVASLVTHRILGTFITTATLFVGFLGLLTINYPMTALTLNILVSMTIISAFALAFLTALCLKEKWTERLVITIIHLVDRITKGRFKLDHVQTRTVDALKAFHESLRTFGSNPTKLVPAVLFNVLSWILGITIVFLVFISIGYLEPNIPTLLLKVTIVYTIVVALKSIPIGVPAEVGLPDVIMATLFGLFGIPLETIGAAATVLTRLLTVWLSFFIGFAVVQWVGVKSLIESGIFSKRKTGTQPT